MFKTTLVVMFVAAFSAATLAAQQRAAAAPQAPAEKPPAPVAKAAPEPPALPVNIRIEVSITDQTGTGSSAKKVVSMIASDRQPVNVRSSASVPVKSPTMGGPTAVQSFTYRTVQINVDARPAIIQKEPNKVSVNFGLEYLPTTRISAQEESSEPGLTSWNQRLSVILESGKPMVVSQAADPTSDRKITVEVTATILK